VLFDKTASLFEKHINILALETASPGNWHCANRRTLLLQLQLQPFNGLFSRTTWVSRYQKGKTNLDFTGATDSE